MSVHELNRVHRRYVRTSNGFKSAWTFHQFIQGLRKVFIEDGPASYPADFQTVYNGLKEVSQNLSEATVKQADEQLDEVDSGLAPLIETLLAADEQVSPGLLRQFFQRVKNYDDNILSQLVKFYLYFRSRDGWNWDRLDKADYLSTKLCEEHQDASDLFVLRDRTEVRETAEGFWAALEAEPVAESEVAALTEEIATLRHEIAGVESIDELHDHRLVERYREFKHQLGDRFFQPQVLMAIIETNLALKNHVRRLYHRDEQRIVAQYQQVFELERETPTADAHLRAELAEFREAVERFEQRLQGGEDIRLDDLAVLRDRMRVLLPRLQPELEMEPEPMPYPPEVREFLADEPVFEKSAAEAALPEDDYVAEQYRTVVAVLDDTNPTTEVRKIVLQPEVFALGIDPREVVAYRRLFGQSLCDRRHEETILRCAALRVRINQDIEEVRGILDDSAALRDSPIFVQSRETLRHAGLGLRHLEHLVEQAVLAADGTEAQSLLRLKMKLTRIHAGLWLVVHKE